MNNTAFGTAFIGFLSVAIILGAFTWIYRVWCWFRRNQIQYCDMNVRRTIQEHSPASILSPYHFALQNGMEKESMLENVLGMFWMRCSHLAWRSYYYGTHFLIGYFGSSLLFLRTGFSSSKARTMCPFYCPRAPPIWWARTSLSWCSSLPRYHHKRLCIPQFLQIFLRRRKIWRTGWIKKCFFTLL